VNLKSKLIF